ncbi:peptidase family M1-domain-containing protein [Globomyces pollinis-pini]|nr:peptidase family M1-domain-containing protein [Globomyces pollinis-pini]
MCCNGTVSGVGSNREVLPKNVKPSNYNVTIVPGLESLKFTGQVSISLTVTEPTKTIVCNANELIVSSASVTALRVEPGGLDKVAHWPKNPTTHRSQQQAISITLQKEAETVTLEFEHEIPVTSNVVLFMEFEGIHNDKMCGFYRSGYTNDKGEKKFLVVTQFEATDCRRCFPCWDEPNLKATFDITLNVPQDRTALSNMNVIEESTIDIGTKTLKSIKFAKTPIMSTYLVALCVGEFDYLEAVANPTSPADAKPITCRVYTLKGQKEMGRFGLGVCTKTLEFFSKYFDVAYPLPKMDMIAIPDFGAGAMENWGLVTYRETALLYDPAKSSAAAKQRVAYVVGHELAHQWFGNLVTMDWWSELWLNEGFATFVGWLAVDHVFPEWNVFTSFVSGDFASGVGLDSLRSSHPIEVEVKSPSEVAQIFDAISYSKGASVIRMLNSFVGGDKFAAGVTAYLKKHAFSNATTRDLWASLAISSGKDIDSMMYAWTREVGYPMITVEDEVFDSAKQELTVTLSQKRFLSSGDLTAEEEKKSPNWFIPIAVVTNNNLKTPTIHTLVEKSGKITFPYSEGPNSFWKLNFTVSGFYRVLYSPSQLERLGRALENNLNDFSTEDRIGIISDAFAFARAGLGSTSGALEILKSYKNEEDGMVLEEIASRFTIMKKVWFKNESAIDGLNQLERSIFSSKVTSMGYEYPATDDHLTVLKRNCVIASAVGAKDPLVIAELKNRFVKYIKGDSTAFHANLRNSVFKSVLSHSNNPAEDWEAVFNIYKNAATADERIAALGSLGAINDMKIVHRILNEITLDSDIVKLQDTMYPVASIATQCPLKEEALEYLWVWCTSNWPTLFEKLSPSLSLLGRVLSYSVNQNLGEDFAQRVEAWARGDELATEEEKAVRVKQVTYAQRPLDQSLESLRSASKWNERETANVSQWLLLNGFSKL